MILGILTRCCDWSRAARWCLPRHPITALALLVGDRKGIQPQWMDDVGGI